MRTRDRLPEECREEIRAELTLMERCHAHLLSRAERSDLKGIVAEDMAEKLKTRIKALAWVLNEEE